MATWLREMRFFLFALCLALLCAVAQATSAQADLARTAEEIRKKFEDLKKEKDPLKQQVRRPIATLDTGCAR